MIGLRVCGPIQLHEGTEIAGVEGCLNVQTNPMDPDDPAAAPSAGVMVFTLPYSTCSLILNFWSSQWFCILCDASSTTGYQQMLNDHDTLLLSLSNCSVFQITNLVNIE